LQAPRLLPHGLLGREKPQRGPWGLLRGEVYRHDGTGPDAVLLPLHGGANAEHSTPLRR